MNSENNIMRAAVSGLLSNYVISVTIDDADMNKMIPVSILNVDGTITKTEAPLHDVLYLTEYGTLTIPPKKIFKRMHIWLREYRKVIIDELTAGIINEGWNEQDIEAALEKFIVRANAQLDSIISSINNETNYISTLTNIDKSTPCLANLNDLRKYIKCRYTKKN